MKPLLATSVVRGSHQGESHGGVYLVDFDTQAVTRMVDWNTIDIDWQGRGWDRGLRGIAFDGERVYIAASDELFAYTPEFVRIASWRNPYLKHCHEIFVWQRRLYLTATGFDAILGFDLDREQFCWGLNIAFDGIDFRGNPFDPNSEQGPPPGNEQHLNNVFCDPRGMYLSGLRSGALLRFDGRRIERVANLPQGVHNARPYRNGILFNDTQADRVCWISRERQLGFPVPRYAKADLEHTELGDERLARQAFGRGLCVVDGALVAAGSSPSTITLYDLDAGESLRSVCLSHDIRNAIHGLAVWPY